MPLCVLRRRKERHKDSTTTVAVEDFAAKFEHEFSLVSIDSSIGSSSFDHVWVVDSGSTRHMNRVHDALHISTELGHYV